MTPNNIKKGINALNDIEKICEKEVYTETNYIDEIFKKELKDSEFDHSEDAIKYVKNYICPLIVKKTKQEIIEKIEELQNDIDLGGCTTQDIINKINQ